MSLQSESSPVSKRRRCSKCLRPLSVCYCSQILCRQNNKRQICIIQDIREASHAIGTARMAALSLSNCQLFTVNPDENTKPAEMASLMLTRPVLIYPGENARDISDLEELPWSPLVFIDASWRRSRKILLTQPWLAELPRYALNADTVSRYRIRQQPVPSAMSTLEAIVYTLQQLEPEPERFNSLLATMDWVVDQQIKHMGAGIWQSNYSKFKKES